MDREFDTDIETAIKPLPTDTPARHFQLACKCVKPIPINTTFEPVINKKTLFVYADCSVCGGSISFPGYRQSTTKKEKVAEPVKPLKPAELSPKNKAMIVHARKDIARLDKALGVARIAYPKSSKEVIRGIKTEPKEYQGSLVSFYGLALSASDLEVLYALIAIGQQQEQKQQLTMKLGVDITKAEYYENDLLPVIKDRDPLNNSANNKEVAVISTSFYAINKILNRSTDSKNNVLIKESLKVLSTFTVFVEKGERWATSHLLGYSKGDKTALNVALSYRITKCLLGEEGALYGALSIKQLSSLPSSISKIIYSFLINWYNRANKNLIGVDALIKHTWGISENTFNKLAPADLNKKRQQIRQAIKEINKLTDFEIGEENDNKVMKVTLLNN